MRLNVRAVTQLMRDSGIEVSATSKADMEIAETTEAETEHDKLIFGREGEIRGWCWLNTNVEEFADVGDEESTRGKVENGMKESGDAVVGNELLKQKVGTAERL